MKKSTINISNFFLDQISKWAEKQNERRRFDSKISIRPKHQTDSEVKIRRVRRRFRKRDGWRIPWLWKDPFWLTYFFSFNSKTFQRLNDFGKTVQLLNDPFLPTSFIFARTLRFNLSCLITGDRNTGHFPNKVQDEE